MHDQKMALLMCLSLTVSCGAGQPEAQEADDAQEVEEDTSYTEAVQGLTLTRVQQSLVNQGCSDMQVLESTELQEPEGFVLVITAELCEGFEELGRLAMLVSAVGNEVIQSNTLLPLPGLRSAQTEELGVLALESHRVSANGDSVVLLRYRVPPEAAQGAQFVERAVLGTFSAEALELTVVQPVNYNVQFGRGRLTGEGTLELADADDDGDLDIRFDLQATGQRCGGGPCRNGQHACQQTSAWTGRRFSDALEGDGCLYLGQLEL